MIWASFAVMIATIMVCAASLRTSRGDAIGIPLVAIGTFTFLYVVQPLQLILTGTAGVFFTEWQVAKGFLISALMLASFMWGWLHPVRQARRWRNPWDPQAMWSIGFAAACLGLIFFVIFVERSGGFAQSFSQAHGKAMAWKENTAYLYDGPWLMLSGAAMMIFGDPKSRAQRWKSFAPYGFCGLYLVNAIIGGDRGPLFSVASVIFVSTAIARRKPTKLRQAVGFLLVLACAVTIVFVNRDRLYTGGSQGITSGQSTEEALNGLVGTSEYDEEHATTGQEFVLHAATIDTVDETGKLGWGLNWVEFLLFNPIPRVIFPEKPDPVWTGVTAGDIFENTSIVAAPGSAWGIVADLYANFHLLSALFFYGLGLGLRRLFVLARSFSSPVTTVGYVMIYALSLNMFAQGFMTILVPVCYSMVPVVLFAWVRRRNLKKALARERDIMLRQFAAAHGERWSS